MDLVSTILAYIPKNSIGTGNLIEYDYDLLILCKATMSVIDQKSSHAETDITVGFSY